MTLLAHLNFHLLLIFVDDAHRQAETHNDEIDRRAICRDRGHPSPLAASLIADAPQAFPSETPGLAHRRHRVVRQKAEILAVGAA